MKTCPQESLVSRYHDDELPDHQRVDIKAHLLTCLNCARYHQSLMRLDQQITSLLREPQKEVRRRRARPVRTALFATACAASVALCFWPNFLVSGPVTQPGGESERYTFETQEGQTYTVATQGDIELLSIEVDGTTTSFSKKEGRP